MYNMKLIQLVMLLRSMQLTGTSVTAEEVCEPASRVCADIWANVKLV